MFRIETKINTNDPGYINNRKAFLELLDKYYERLSAVRKGG